MVFQRRFKEYRRYQRTRTVSLSGAMHTLSACTLRRPSQGQPSQTAPPGGVLYRTRRLLKTLSNDKHYEYRHFSMLKNTMCSIRSMLRWHASLRRSLRYLCNPLLAYSSIIPQASSLSIVDLTDIKSGTTKRSSRGCKGNRRRGETAPPWGR